MQNINIALATSNSHKIKEIKAFFKNTKNINFYKLSDWPEYKAPEETGSSFKENARIKARSLALFLKTQKHSLKNFSVLGEDSGLSVKALNGAPGIYSARYSPEGTDTSSLMLLLKNLQNVSDRQAHYTCSICYISADKEACFEAHLYGCISLTASGSQGFGYDSCFIPKGARKTLGELDAKTKQSLSHRSLALKSLSKYLSLHYE